MQTVILIAQAAAIFMLLAEIFYIAMQRPSRTQTILLIMCISTLINMLGYLVELTTSGISGALMGTAFAYVGKTYSLLAYFLFASHYCGIRIHRKVLAVLVIYHALFPLLIFTNDFHHLYYSSVAFYSEKTYSPLVLGHGPLYYLYVFTMVAYLLIILILAIREYRRSRSKEGKEQILYIFAMLATVVISYVVYLLGITNGYDSTMIGCFIAALLLFILFIKYRLFDSLTLAFNQAMNDSATGLLVLNPHGNVTYSNAAAKAFTASIMPLEDIRVIPEESARRHHDGRTYDIQRKTVMDQGRDFGQIIEISDISDSYNYSQRLERDVEERTCQIHNIQRSILGSFASIVEARDSNTGTHIKKTGDYVQLILTELSRAGLYSDILDTEYCTCLTDVAPLHDIGKLKIPDSILLKPGRLTPEEFEVIKTHTTEGAKIINECMRGVETDEYVSLAEEVVLNHHEKWDGSGYPNKISGRDIPLSARIMAVADVYDAIRSERCYKKAMDREQAKAEILAGRGKHFDPDVADAFLAGIDAMEDAEEAENK